MSADPSEPGPPDYAHTHDEQAQRTRYELWVIVAVVLVVIVGAVAWRAFTRTPPGPQAGWNRTDPSAAPTPATTAAAAAGVSPHGAAPTPAPRPVAP